MTDRTKSPSEVRWLPEGSAAARLIVCEQAGRWAAALRQHLGAAGPRFHETRSLAECWEVLGRCSASFVVVEVTGGNLGALLDGMVLGGRQCPLARMAAVADRRLAECEWLLREAGAVHFVTSPRCTGPLARLACRHLAQAPSPKRTFTQRVWEGLPWGGSGE